MRKRDLKNKGLAVLLSVLMLLLVCGITIFAAEENTESRVIRVGYTNRGQMIQKTGESFGGYGVAYLQSIASFTGWKYEYIPVAEEERVEALIDGKFDLLCDITMDEVGADKLILSRENSCMNYALLCAKKDDTSVFFNEFDAMDGKRIAVNESRKMKHLVDEFAREHNISYTPVYCDGFLQMEAAVEDGRADLLVTSNQRELSGYKYVAKAGLRNQYFAVAPANRDIMTALDSADKKIKINQPFFIGALYDTFYGRPSEILTGVTREEFEFLESGVSVRVACDDNSFPLEYLDEKTGKYRGVYADAMELLSAETGLKFQFVPVYERSAWDVMESGEVDMSIGMYINDNLRERYGFLSASPYIVEDYTLIVRADETLDGPKRLALPAEFVGLHEYVREFYPQYEIVSCKSNEACLRAVESRAVDGTLINAIFLQTVFNLSNYNGLIALPMHTVEVPVSCTFTGPNARVLCQMIDKAIHRIPERKFEDCVLENAVKVAYEPSAKDVLKKYFPFILMLLSAFVILYAGTLWTRERRYRTMARTDALTGLMNGRFFRVRAEEILSQKGSKEYQLVSFDLERFKYVNKDFGEKTADEILKIIAERLQSTMGKSAICARDMGDTFLVLTEARVDLEPMLHELGSEVYFEKSGIRQYYKPELKFGICSIREKDTGFTVNDYINQASAARKSIKGNSTREAASFNEEMAKTISHEALIESRMVKALQEEEFVVFYQPKYNLQNNQITGAEALVRWNSPEDGMLPPNLFIPIFERNGFIIRLDFYVYEQALKTIANWKKSGGHDIVISVNVSRTHIGTADFVTRLVQLADKYQVPHRLLELELTETVAGGNSQDVIDFIWECKKFGFPISIDDFGSGYSSLNLLKNLPVDVLKIDREFLNETEVSEKSSIIIEQIVDMAARLQIHTLCEGVETVEQAEFLKKIGCDMAQGYLYSRPVPLTEFKKLLKNDMNK